MASKSAAFEHNPPWGKEGHSCSEARRNQVLLTCHRCYYEGYPIFYGLTSQLVHSPEAALWEFGSPRSAFWGHVSLVKEMHILEDGGAGRLRPAEFPALWRLVIHPKSSSPGYEFLHNGAASNIPTIEASDEEIIAWVRTNADYEFFVKVCFETE